MKKILSCALAGLLIIAVLAPLTALTALAETDEQDERGEPCPICGGYHDYCPYDPYDQDSPYYGLPLVELMGIDSPEEFVEYLIKWFYVDPEKYDTPWEALFLPKDVFILVFEINDEDELSLILEAWKRAADEAGQKHILILEELGGTPGIINVMYNGGFIKFPGAVPEIIDGTAFVPTRQLFETLGATLAYDERTGVISAVFPDKTLEFAAGRDTLDVIYGDRTNEIGMYAAPYNKNGLTFFPVRSAALILDIEALWDNVYRTIVIIDRAPIIMEANKNFTIINSLLDMQDSLLPAEDGAYEAVLEAVMSMIVFNSIDGDQTIDSGGEMTIITDGRNTYMHGKADLSGIVKIMLSGIDLDDINDIYPETELAQINELIGKLSDLEAEIILNYDEDTMYIRMPLLGDLVFGELPVEIPPDAWIAVSGVNAIVDNGSLESIFGELGISDLSGNASFAEFIMPAGWEYRYEGIFAYGLIMESVEYNTKLFGDDRFTENGGEYTLSLTIEEFNEIAAEYGQFVSYDDFDLNITVVVSEGSIAGVSGNVRIREQSWDTDTLFTAGFGLGPERIWLNFEIHEKNTMKVIVDIDMSMKTATGPVPGAPPAGDPVIPIEDLLGPIPGEPPGFVEPQSYTQ